MMDSLYFPMRLRRQEPPWSYKSLESYQTKLIWSLDGWVYDSVAMKRRRYKVDDFLHMEEEATGRSVYSGEIENVTIHILSADPKIWIEEGETFKEMYVEVN